MIRILALVAVIGISNASDEYSADVKVAHIVNAKSQNGFVEIVNLNNYDIKVSTCIFLDVQFKDNNGNAIRIKPFAFACSWGSSDPILQSIAANKTAKVEVSGYLVNKCPMRLEQALKIAVDAGLEISGFVLSDGNKNDAFLPGLFVAYTGGGS